jgi:hypothetical protein
MWDTTALDAQLRWLSLERRSHRPALPQSNETHLGPATTPYRTATLSLSSRPERSGAEGPAVPRTLHGNVLRTAPTCPGVPWRNLQLPKEPPKLHWRGFCIPRSPCCSPDDGETSGCAARHLAASWPPPDPPTRNDYRARVRKRFPLRTPRSYHGGWSEVCNGFWARFPIEGRGWRC